MPRNPTKWQIVASRENLKGYYGPKTAAGKINSAKNGFLNKGVKTAKARAKVINGRWEFADTFYALAGCLDCKKKCYWISFSPKTLLKELPLFCLREVLQERPDKCFYYFEGICCIDIGRSGRGFIMKNICILNGDIIKIYEDQKRQQDTEIEQQLELRDRLKNEAYKKEISTYLMQIRASKGKKLLNTPRMKYLCRYFWNIIRNNKFCQLEPWRKNVNDLDTLFLQVLEKTCNLSKTKKIHI